MKLSTVQTKNLIFFLTVVFLLAYVFWYFFVDHSKPIDKIVIYYKPENEKKQNPNNENISAYTQFGKLLETRLKEKIEKFDVTQRDTEGSLDTLLKMESTPETPSVGIVQADVLYHYVNGKNGIMQTPKHESSIRAVAKLFPEWIHIRKNSTFDKILNNVESIHAGDRGSGSYVTSMNVGNFLNAPWVQDISSSITKKDGYYLFVRSPSKKSSDLKHPSLIDKCIAVKPAFLTKAESMIIAHAFNSKIYKSISSEELKRYGYEPTKDDYSLVKLDAVLVVNKKVPDKYVEEILKYLTEIDLEIATDKISISEDIKKIRDHTAYNEALESLKKKKENKKKTPKELAELTIVERTEDLPISAHPWVQARRLDSLSKCFLAIVDIPIIWLAIFVCPMAIIGSVYLTKAYSYNKEIYATSQIRWFVHKYAFLIVAICVFVVIHVGVASLVWHAEYRSGSLKPETPLANGGIVKALGWLWEMLTLNRSRYELRSDLSVFWIAVLKGTYWISGITLTGLIAKHIAERLPRRMMKKHTLVIGWRNDAQVLISDLIDQKKQVKVFVFTDQALQDAESYYSNKPGIELEKIESLENAVSKSEHFLAESIIILGDNYLNETLKFKERDLWVLKALHCFEKEFVKETISDDSVKLARDNVKIVAEVQLVENIPLVEEFADEGICVNEFGMAMIARSATTTNQYKKLLRELMKFSSDNNEFYFYKLKEKERMKAVTFRNLIELHEEAAENNEVEEKCIIIGYSRKGDDDDVKLNPEKNARLRNSDEIIVISRHSPERLLAD